MKEDPYERNDFYEPREAKTPLPRGTNSQPMTNTLYRKGRLFADGAYTDEAEWVKREDYDRLKRTPESEVVQRLRQTELAVMHGAQVGPQLLADAAEENTQLRGNLSLAEEGLAAAMQESGRLKTLLDSSERQVERLQSRLEGSQAAAAVGEREIEQLKRNLAWQSQEIDAQVQEIQRLRACWAEALENVTTRNQEIERLQAQLKLETAALEQACAQWGKSPPEPLAVVSFGGQNLVLEQPLEAEIRAATSRDCSSTEDAGRPPTSEKSGEQ